MSDYLKELSSEFSENLKLNYDLKKKNWFNIGGKTKIYYKAKNLKELIKFLKKINNKEKIFILGGGSNTLITDNDYDGVVIRLLNNFNNISLLSEEIIKKSKVELFLVNDKYQLAKYIKHNIYGDKIVIGMGAGSISSWMREMPKFL